ncbi:hypothetical protein BC936DRAFT_141238, partial [Jimgerdemannia flammicorona]
MVRDATVPDASDLVYTKPMNPKQNLYIISDLASLLLRHKCKSASWPLTSYPGQVRMQPDLFKSLGSSSLQSENMKKNYLPKEFQDALEAKAGHEAKKADKVNVDIMLSLLTLSPSWAEKKTRAVSQSPTKSPAKKRKGSVTPSAAEKSAPSTATRKTQPRIAKSNSKTMRDLSSDEEDEDTPNNDGNEMDVDEEENQNEQVG